MKPDELGAHVLNGILRTDLFVGVVSQITSRMVSVNLSEAGRASGSHFEGVRYGRGEVEELVLIEGQNSLLLGRMYEVKLHEPERKVVTRDFSGRSDLDAIGSIQLLGCVALDDLAVTAGVDHYPRLGDRVYSAPHKFVSLLPALMERDNTPGPVTLKLGKVSGPSGHTVEIRPERLFGRHCAILGATGGGKSWTTARIIEECMKHNCKIILIDATGEYRGFKDRVIHRHLGKPHIPAEGSTPASLPSTSFDESDYFALFMPALRTQAPRMREAIRSLRLAAICSDVYKDGYIVKANTSKDAYKECLKRAGTAVDNPTQAFDITKLAEQIRNECVFEDAHRWNGIRDNDIDNCAPLIGRINLFVGSPVFDFVFATYADILAEVQAFMKDNNRLARLDLSGVSHSLHAREIVVNALGRRLLSSSRSASEPRIPTLLVLDEAHQFVGKEIGGDDNTAKLDAFELIAKEGRKYGLSICLATQRPRDVTEGVLSQMGTLIVHRLTNDKDREVVERACGEIDKAATAILPNLRPGEAAIIGVDFPIPLKLSITEPTNKPESRGPDFQGSWGKAEETGKEEENGQKQEQQPSDEQASVNQAQQQDGKEQRPETEQAAYSDDVPF